MKPRNSSLSRKLINPSQILPFYTTAKKRLMSTIEDVLLTVHLMLLSADENEDHAKLAGIKILNKHNFYVHDYIMINNVEPQFGFVNTYCPNVAEKCDFHRIIELTIILRHPYRTRIRRTRWDWPFLHSCSVENTPFPSKSLACVCRIFVIWFCRSIQLLECKLNKPSVFERLLIRWIF